MISRRRFLAGAVTGATLLVIPREVLGPAGQASATTGNQRASGVDAAVSTGGSVTATNLASSQTPQPPPRLTAGPSAITADAQYDVASETITYASLMGTVYRPQTSAAHPVVYFLHGGFWEYGGRQQYQHEAQVWAARGWVAVTLDYPLTTSYATMLQRLWAGIGLVQRQWYADTQRQILFGDSAGGHLAALLAVQHPEQFRGQILWSPVISPANAYRDGVGLLGSRLRLSQAAKRTAGRDWAAADPSRQVTAGTPPLWIAGSSREFVSFQRQGQLLVDALGSDRSDVHLIRGIRHGKNLERGSLLSSARAWARAHIQ